MKCVETERDHKPENRKMWILKGKTINPSYIGPISRVNQLLIISYSIYFPTIIKAINNIQEENQNFSSKKSNFIKRKKPCYFGNGGNHLAPMNI